MRGNPYKQVLKSIEHLDDEQKIELDPEVLTSLLFNDRQIRRRIMSNPRRPRGRTGGKR